MAPSGRLVTRQMGNCTARVVRMEPSSYGRHVASHMDYGDSCIFRFQLVVDWIATLHETS